MLAVKEHRVQKGLSQEALADAAGVGVRTIRRAESGGHIPHAGSLLRIAEALGVSLDALFSEHAENATSANGDPKEAPGSGAEPAGSSRKSRRDAETQAVEPKTQNPTRQPREEQRRVGSR